MPRYRSRNVPGRPSGSAVEVQDLLFRQISKLLGLVAGQDGPNAILRVCCTACSALGGDPVQDSRQESVPITAERPHSPQTCQRRSPTSKAGGASRAKKEADRRIFRSGLSPIREAEGPSPMGKSREVVDLISVRRSRQVAVVGYAV